MDSAAAFEEIQVSILPGISLLLDELLDSAVLALPGVDGAAYADELRSLASQVEDLTQRVGSLAFVQQPARLRISA